MSEQPVERASAGDLLAVALYRRPRVVIKADLLPAVSVASLIALLGVLVGWIWSVIAPPEKVGVSSDGSVLPLIDESYHRFDDLAIFQLIGLGAGLVTGIAVWFLRERRGPTILVAAVLGSAVAAYLAQSIGVSFAAGRYVITGAPKIGQVFDRAPTLNTYWVLIVQPLGTAIAYFVLAAWNGAKDLGRRLG